MANGAKSGSWTNSSENPNETLCLGTSHGFRGKCLKFTRTKQVLERRGRSKSRTTRCVWTGCCFRKRLGRNNGRRFSCYWTPSCPGSEWCSSLCRKKAVGVTSNLEKSIKLKFCYLETMRRAGERQESATKETAAAWAFARCHWGYL